MRIVKDEEPSATIVPEFDPNKKYSWTPDTKFELNGQEFASLLNSLRAFLGTENSQIVLLAKQASDSLEDQLRKAVEEGRAVEIQ